MQGSASVISSLKLDPVMPNSGSLVGAQHARAPSRQVLSRKGYRSRAENAPPATSAATASISGANGLSTDNMGDFARTVSCALRASVPVCNGASRSIPWHAHNSSIAIELLCACQGIDLLAPLQTGTLARRAYASVRAKSHMLSEDRPLAPDIEAVGELVADGAFSSLLG